MPSAALHSIGWFLALVPLALAGSPSAHGGGAVPPPITSTLPPPVDSHEFVALCSPLPTARLGSRFSGSRWLGSSRHPTLGSLATPGPPIPHLAVDAEPLRSLCRQR